MDYRRLGRSGLTVSAAGLGCNNFGRTGTPSYTQEGTDHVVDAAIDAGITLFDTADIYGETPGLSETLLGNALGNRRDDIVLATKFGHSGRDAGILSWGAKGSRRYVRRAVEASLRRLRTEWIDLYQLHTPDPETPIEETLDVLDDLIREGKVRYIGHSNFAAWQLVEAEKAAEIERHPRFISAQNEYSLVKRSAERELFPAAERFGVGILPFFPLQNGLLTGKFTREGGPQDSRIMRQRPHLIENAPWEAMERYQRLCDEAGMTMLQATFAWLLSKRMLGSVIAGATRPEQVRLNAEAAVTGGLSADMLRELDSLFPVSDS